MQTKGTSCLERASSSPVLHQLSHQSTPLAVRVSRVLDTVSPVPDLHGLRLGRVEVHFVAQLKGLPDGREDVL